MKTLPNGLTIFNATPHTIRFWDESWDEPIEADVDVVVNAVIDNETGQIHRVLNSPLVL